MNFIVRATFHNGIHIIKIRFTVQNLLGGDLLCVSNMNIYLFITVTCKIKGQFFFRQPGGFKNSNITYYYNMYIYTYLSLDAGTLASLMCITVV